jgi:hypothetical protein
MHTNNMPPPLMVEDKAKKRIFYLSPRKWIWNFMRFHLPLFARFLHSAALPKGRKEFKAKKVQFESEICR